MATSPDPWKKLREPFPGDKVKTKPGRGQGGKPMSFISHGLITERLNEADPDWSSQVLTEHIYKDPQTGRLHCEGVTLALTVNGVTRVEAGGPQRQDGFANEIKNAYSDALKRAAMRFGVALEMWESLVDAEDDEDYAAEAYASAASTAPTRPDTKLTPDQRKRIWALAHEVWPKRPDDGIDVADVNLHDEIGRKWKVSSLNDLTAEQADTYIERLAALRAKNATQSTTTGTPAPRGTAGNDRYTNP